MRCDFNPFSAAIEGIEDAVHILLNFVRIEDESVGSLVEVRQTYDLSEALCAKSFLDSCGIFSFVQNEHHITMSSGVLGVALGGFRILVSSEDAIEAKRQFEAADANKYELNDDFDESRISRW